MSKITEDFNFKKYKTYNVEDIGEHISSFADEWFINTSRQDRFYVHKDTNSYFVYTANLEWKAGEKFYVEKTSNDEKLLKLLEPIIQDLEKTHKGVRGNVLLIKLKAKLNIDKHQDSGDYLMFSRRNHIPVITSKNVFFGVGEDKVSMNVGECWEINNSKLHFVDNDSDIDRIHLLIDIMPNKEVGL